MKKLLLTAVLAVVAAPVFAGADCKAHPKNEWMPQATMMKNLEAQGYQIKKFKVDGNCYEMYGKDKAGKKVEIYFDTKTGQAVKSKN